MFLLSVAIVQRHCWNDQLYRSCRFTFTPSGSACSGSACTGSGGVGTYKLTGANPTVGSQAISGYAAQQWLNVLHKETSRTGTQTRQLARSIPTSKPASVMWILARAPAAPAPSATSAPVPKLSISISSPTNGTLIRGNGSVNIASNVSDTTSIQKITIKGDDNVLYTCTGVHSCATTWQGKNISKGTHVISATATNSSGLTSSASIMILDLR